MVKDTFPWRYVWNKETGLVVLHFNKKTKEHLEIYENAHYRKMNCMVFPSLMIYIKLMKEDHCFMNCVPHHKRFDCPEEY